MRKMQLVRNLTLLSLSMIGMLVLGGCSGCRDAYARVYFQDCHGRYYLDGKCCRNYLYHSYYRCSSYGPYCYRDCYGRPYAKDSYGNVYYYHR